MKKALGLLAAVALSFAGANSLDQIKSANTLKIGVADHAAPFSKLNRDGEFEGFEVDTLCADWEIEINVPYYECNSD